MESSEIKRDNFSDKEIIAIVALEDVLRRIHDRLIKEGYTIKEGQFIEPKVIEF